MATLRHMTSLVLLPVIITEAGQYRTRSGEIVTIHTIEDTRAHRFCCRGFYTIEKIGEDWHRSGRLLATSETANDIMARA